MKKAENGQGSYAGAALAGLGSAAIVTMPMTVLDMAVIRSQLSKTGLRDAMQSVVREMLSGSGRLTPGFGIMFGVYSATFVTANVSRHACREHRVDPVLPVALATSLVNSFTCIGYKDQAFPRLVGGGASLAPTLPFASYILFGARDLITISASFVAVPIAREHLVTAHHTDERTASVAASFGVPMLAQLFATPLNMLALDVYNRPYIEGSSLAASVRARFHRIAASFVSVVTGRMMRVVPAYGVGTLVNERLMAMSREMATIGGVGVGVHAPTGGLAQRMGEGFGAGVRAAGVTAVSTAQNAAGVR